MYVNYLKAQEVPSIAENPRVMARTIDSLAENPGVSRIIFVQQRNYNYSSDQILLLAEIARVYNFLTKQEAILSPEKLSLFGTIKDVYGDLVYLLNLLKQDPIACYVEVKKRILDSRKQLDSGQVGNKSALVNYIRLLERIHGLLENTKLIQKSLGNLGDYFLGSREIYFEIFRPNILPNFTFTRLVAQLPKHSDLIDQYSINTGDEEFTVTILKVENESKYFYHVMPPEYSLNDDHHNLVNLARNVLTEHRPKAEEFTDPDRTRQVFFNVSRDLLGELSKSKGINLSHKELIKLAKILVRHTIGFGLIEVLLMDKKLQDIVLNVPLVILDALEPLSIREFSGFRVILGLIVIVGIIIVGIIVTRRFRHFKKSKKL